MQQPSIVIGRNPVFQRLRNLAMLLPLIILVTLRTGAGSSVAEDAQQGYDTIDATHLEALLKFIAADELEGRNTGDRGLDIAALFLESQYRLAGLTPPPGQVSMLQYFDVVESVLQGATFEVVDAKQGQDFRLLQDFLVNSTHSKSFDQTFPLLFAGYGFRSKDGMHDDFKGIDANGKALVVIDGSPEAAKDSSPRALARKLRALRRSKATWAKEAGASAIIHVSATMNESTMDRLRNRLKRPRQRLAEAGPSLPQFVVTARVGDALLQGSGWNTTTLLKSLEHNAQGLQVDISQQKAQMTVSVASVTKRAQNVVAYLEGSDPDLKQQVVAFGAHYDHVGMNGNGDIFNGADDDGSGTVGMLEVARAFAGNGKRPRRSMIFVSHAGEEKGLLGSKFYTNHPLVPLGNTVAQLNVDMIGRNDPNAVYIIGSNFLSRELHTINETANQSVGLDLDYGYNDLDDPNRFYYRSDHYNYAKHGIPIIFYFSGTHEDYHQPTDTVDKIDFTKMQRIVRLLYLTGWQVGNLDHRLAQDGLLLEAL